MIEKLRNTHCVSEAESTGWLITYHHALEDIEKAKQTREYGLDA